MRSAYNIRVTNRNWRTLAAFADTRTQADIDRENAEFDARERAEAERNERLAQFRALALPLITFPYESTLDVQNGITFVCIAVNGKKEWVPIAGQGKDERIKELGAMWRHYHREFNRIVNQQEQGE